MRWLDKGLTVNSTASVSSPIDRWHDTPSRRGSRQVARDPCHPAPGGAGPTRLLAARTFWSR
eukprot:3919478-Pyramimonas_sp.AAC.1